LNAGAGSVRILLPGERTYSAGLRQRIRVEVSDSQQRRWGFQLSARLAGSPATGQAGELASADALTQVICANGRPIPCASASTIQFITHTSQGTRNGTTGSVSFEFDWTPPAEATGRITLYAAGNAANGDGRNTGDRIYTTSIDLDPVAAAPRPSISAERGVVNAASFQPGITPGGWTTITGANLAAATRTWRSDEIAGGKLPVSLDDIGVTINGKAAYVYFISPEQINVIAPADDSVGPVEVRVTSKGQTSDAAIAMLQSLAPAFFTFDGKFVAATHADNNLLGRPGLFPSAPAATTAAKPGETIVLYGSGWGPTEPGIPAGQLADRVARLSNPVNITIGGLPAEVSFGGLVPPFAQLYQFNVKVPEALADGDHLVAARIQGVDTPNSAQCCFVTVQR